MDAFCVNSGPQRNKCQHKSLCAGSPHSELAIGADSLCSVLCWEKPRGSMARCECCSGFQGEIAGGCQAVVLLIAGSVKRILSRVPQWPPHLPHPIWALTSSCRVDTCLTLLMFDTPTQTNVLILLYLWPTGITIWITSHLSHSQVLAVCAGLPLLPHPRWTVTLPPTHASNLLGFI